MARNIGLDATGRELGAIASYKALSAAIKQARNLTVKFGVDISSVGQMAKSGSEKRRQEGYSSFLANINAFKGKIGGSEGETIDKLIEASKKRLESIGGANASGKELSKVIGDLQKGLESVSGSLGGDESKYVSRMIRGLSEAQSNTRLGGFKGIAGGQKDMIKAAFGMSSFSMVKDALASLSTDFKNTSTVLKDPGLKAAINRIKQSMDSAASAATTSSEKLKALGNAKKSLEALIKSSSGIDKGAMQALQMNINRLESEIRKANSGRMMAKVGQVIAKPFVSGAKMLGQTISVLGMLKRTFDVGNGLFQTINGKINQFARMQIGITSERAGYGRSIRGSGIRTGDMMSAISAGRTAGMEDSTVIGQMVNLQTELSKARWGEGGLIDAAGRWGISTYNGNGDVKSANEMMIEFSRKLRSLGSDMEKLQFLTHLNFRPDQMEYVANYESEAKRMEKLRANPHLQGVLDRADILDEDGTSARIDKYTKLEQRRRQILNQNAIDKGILPGIKRAINPENWLFNDWTARQKGIRGANAEIANEKMTGIISDILNTIKENGGDKKDAISSAFESSEMTPEVLMGLVDSLKATADMKGDQSLVRDFEAAFKNMTGITLDTTSEVEKLCHTLNETFSNIVDWVTNVVKKIRSLFGGGEEGKEEAKGLGKSAAKGAGIGTGTYVAGKYVQKAGDALSGASEKAGTAIEGKLAGSSPGFVRKIASKAAGGSVAVPGKVTSSVLSGTGKALKKAAPYVGIASIIWDYVTKKKNQGEDSSSNKENTNSVVNQGKDSSSNEENTNSVGGEEEYAEGGKSSKRAVFGEKGPEYAIPVKHTKRTASLINAVAQESGFGRPIDEGSSSVGGEEEYAEGGRVPDKGKVNKLSIEEYHKRLQRRAGNRRDRTLEGLQQVNKENEEAYLANLDQGDAFLIAAGEAVKRVTSGQTFGLSNLVVPDSHNDLMRNIYDENPELELLANLGEFGSAFSGGLAKVGAKTVGAIKNAGKAADLGSKAAKTTSAAGNVANAAKTTSEAGNVAKAAKAPSAAENVANGKISPGTYGNLASKRKPAVEKKPLYKRGSVVKGTLTAGSVTAQMALDGDGDDNASPQTNVAGAPSNTQNGGNGNGKWNGQGNGQGSGQGNGQGSGQENGQGSGGKEGKAKNSAISDLKDSEFLKLIRDQIKGGASDESIKKLFEDRNLRDVNIDMFRNKQFMGGGREGDEYGKKLMGGMYLAQENADASVLAGKNVNVQNELANLTDKYAIAWKNSGQQFDDYNQRVAVAARQNGASDSTTFKEMLFYLKEGWKYGQKQTEELAKVHAELAKKEENKGLSKDELRKKAEEETKKRFVQNFDAKTWRDVAKYDKEGNELTDEKDIIANRDRIAAENGVTVETKNKFTSEQQKELEDYIAKHGERSLEENYSMFGVEHGMSSNDVAEMAAYGKSPEEMSEAQKELYEATPAGRQQKRKAYMEEKRKERDKKFTDYAENASEDEIMNTAKTATQRGDAKAYMTLREKQKSGQELSDNEKKAYEKFGRNIGRKIALNKPSEPTPTRGLSRVRKHGWQLRGDSNEEDVKQAQEERRREDAVRAANKEKEDKKDKRPNPRAEIKDAPKKSNRRRGGNGRGTVSVTGSGKPKISITGQDRPKISLTGKDRPSISLTGKDRPSISLTGKDRPSISLSSPSNYRSRRVSGRRAHSFSNTGDKVRETENVASSGRTARGGNSRAMANTAAKAQAAEEAAATGNSIKSSGASSAHASGGKSSGGNSFSVSSPITVNITFSGNLDSNAARELGSQIGQIAAEKINDSVASVIAKAGTQ